MLAIAPKRLALFTAISVITNYQTDTYLDCVIFDSLFCIATSISFIALTAILLFSNSAFLLFIFFWLRLLDTQLLSPR